MKNKKIKNLFKKMLIVLSILLPISFIMLDICTKVKFTKNKKPLVLNAKKLTLKTSDMYKKEKHMQNNMLSAAPKNNIIPKYVVNIGSTKTSFGTGDIQLIKNLYDLLKKRFSHIAKVKKWIDSYSGDKLIHNYNKPAFIDELKNLTKSINTTNNYMNLGTWFRIEAPKFSESLLTGITSPVTSFHPKIAEFDKNSIGIFKVKIHVESSFNINFPNNTNDLTLYVRNNGKQFSTKTTNKLIDDHDVFIRDENKTTVSSNIDSIDLVSLGKEGNKAGVYLNLKPNQKVDINVEKVGKDDIGVKAGYLNSDPKFGLNTTIPSAGLSTKKTNVYSVGNDVLNNVIKFSLAKGEHSEINLPLFYNKNLLKDRLMISLTNKSGLSIAPQNIRVDSSIMKKKVSPIKIEHQLSSSGNLAYFQMTLKDGMNISKNTKQFLTFIDLGLKPEDKVFFENIITNPQATKITEISINSFVDPNKITKEIMAKIFSNWLQVKGYEKRLTSQVSSLSFITHNITHSNYKNIKVSKIGVVNKNIEGKKIVELIRTENKNIINILKKIGKKTKIFEPELFKPSSNLVDVLRNMNNWLYSYYGESNKKLKDITTLISILQGKGVKNIKGDKQIISKVETFLAELVQKRENELINNFKDILMGGIYNIFGKALINAGNDSDLILDQLIEKKAVKISNKITINNILKKKSWKMAKIKNKKDYLKQIINKMMNIIYDNGFYKFLFANPHEFEKNYKNITNEKIYDASNKMNQKTNFSDAKKSFRILEQFFNILGFDIKDLNNLGASNQSKTLKLIKEKFVQVQEKLLYGERAVRFFDKTSKIGYLDSWLVVQNEYVVLNKMKLEKNRTKDNIRHIESLLKKNLNADNSISLFAVMLKKYNSRKYVEYYSNNVEKHSNDLYKLDIKQLDYSLSKPLTPNYFGKFLGNTKTILSSTLLIIGFALFVVSIFLLFFVKVGASYSFQKFSVRSIFENSSKNKIIRKKNILLITTFVGILILSILLFVIGAMITSGLIVPSIFLI